MSPFLAGILLIIGIGNQFQISEAQALTTVIRIQSALDNSFVGVGPITTLRGVEKLAVPVPVEPIPTPVPGNNTIHWKVNWANSFSSGTVIVASDATTSKYRSIGQADDGVMVTVTDLDSISQVNPQFMWNFISVFDSTTWTYKYKITNKSGGKCLTKNGNFQMTTCTPTANTDRKFLFNILS